jgi:hypothetical protein
MAISRIALAVAATAMIAGGGGGRDRRGGV